MFCVEIESAAYVRFNGSSWQDWAWDPQRGLRKQTHQDAT
jgi:hypothetical protein